MPSKKTTKKKPTQSSAKDAKKQEQKNPLIEKRARTFGIGGNIQPKRNLTRFVRWPKYVKLQRQRRVLLQRLKVPPTINQFTRTVDKGTATQLFKLLNKYKPETKAAKKQRLLKAAESKKDKDAAATASKKPNVVKYGINHVTALVEQKKAKLVVIAHDVDPLEIVLWLPTLCRKLEVPYCIVKGKSRLGEVVNHKTAAALAITNVNKEDANDLKNLTTIFLDNYNKNTDIRKQWGGGRLGVKSVAAQRKKEKAIQKEESARMTA